jgi:SAM-dependent methyltransferase
VTQTPEFGREYYVANGQLGDRPALRWYSALARRYLGDGPVLDVGSGTGFLLRRLSKQSEADGIEVSEFSAALARETSPSSRIYADAKELDRNRYARVTSIHVVEHLDDETLREVLADVRSSTTPDARWLVVTPDLGGAAHALCGERWIAFTDATHINLKTHAQWRAFFEGEGFEIVREGSDGLWNNPYARLPRVLDRIRYSLPMAAQFLSGRMFLRPGSGESSLFVLRSRPS